MDAHQGLTRRQCLKLLGAAGLACSAPALFVHPAGAVGLHQDASVSKTLPMMNTLVSMTVQDPSRERATQAMETAFQSMHDLVPIFNRFDPASHVSHLNSTGVLRDVPPPLAQVLKSAQELSLSSSQSFDITILPLLELTQSSLQTMGHPPHLHEVKELMSAIGQDKVSMHSGTVRFAHPDTRITLDGIAKGFIVDRAAAVLKSQGIASAMINAGGDIRVVGDTKGHPWHIGIQDPSGRKSHVQTVALTDMAVATSGSYEDYFDPLMRHHHLVGSDATGSPRRVISATAVAPSAMLADGLSTALFLLPPKQAVSLASSLKNVEASIITQGGRSFTSANWSRITV